MKNNDYWMRFFKTGRIDDYLHYIACTREESADEIAVMDIDKEGGAIASNDLCDGDGPVGHADW